MSKTDKRNERRGGFYWVDGTPYVSVTTVLKCIDKPALRYWFGKEVYQAMVKDPTLSEKEARSAPYASSKKAKSRGTTVHSIVEAYTVSKKKIDSIPEVFQGYAKAFYSWVDEFGFEIVEHEKTVYSVKHRYAGTLDLLGKKNGDNWIVDVKTGKGIYSEAWLQLSAYQEAVREKDKLDTEIGVLLLKDDGKYQFEKGESNLQAFLATKELWMWVNQNLYNKMMEGGE